MPRPAVSLVAAVARDGGIGHGGGLLVRLPDDLRRFKQITLGTPIVMGRKTWQSIGRPLPGRRNIVVTRDAAFRAEGAETAASLDAALGRVAARPRSSTSSAAPRSTRWRCRSPTSCSSPRSTPSSRPTRSFRHGTGGASPKSRASRARRAEGLRYAFVTYKKTAAREIEMSEHGFHVHGPHDHALEHEAHAEPQGLAGRLAVATAIIATIGALFAYMGGLTQANAGLYKNESAIKKTEASNQWNYYQAKSSKQNLAELAVELAPRIEEGLLRRRDQALQAGEGRDQEGRREVRGASPTTGASAATSRSTSITAGRRRRRRCRSRSRWRRSRC